MDGDRVPKRGLSERNVNAFPPPVKEAKKHEDMVVKEDKLEAIYNEVARGPMTRARALKACMQLEGDSHVEEQASHDGGPEMKKLAEKRKQMPVSGRHSEDDPAPKKANRQQMGVGKSASATVYRGGLRMSKLRYLDNIARLEKKYAAVPDSGVVVDLRTGVMTGGEAEVLAEHAMLEELGDKFSMGVLSQPADPILEDVKSAEALEECRELNKQFASKMPNLAADRATVKPQPVDL